MFYIVNEAGAHTVRVYNNRWMLVTSVAGWGDDDGHLNYPLTARFLPDYTIIVCDYWNLRISRFSMQGEFKGHLIKQSDGISYPDRLAVQYPYVWVNDGDEYPYNIKDLPMTNKW